MIRRYTPYPSSPQHRHGKDDWRAGFPLWGARRDPALRAQYGGPPAGPGRVKQRRYWLNEMAREDGRLAMA